jgi:hypothetical protein
MTQQHPITPPPELVEQWAHLPADWNTVAFLIAQWGADAELEACCEWTARCAQWETEDVAELRAARRPKAPSLKEQALDELDGIAAVFRMSHGGDLICDKIRRALEALPDD